ncbi:MAG: transposase [Bacteroidia bacterium]|nr:transposase [Bacteroidia bacterium]
MGYLKIWIHLVWTTKNREPFLTVHCLISLKANQTTDNILMLLKGESSHWINTNKLTNAKFAWQNEYFAVSVSESAVNKVRDYIKNQEEHHRKKSFQEEYDEFMQKYGFERFVSG